MRRETIALPQVAAGTRRELTVLALRRAGGAAEGVPAGRAARRRAAGDAGAAAAGGAPGGGGGARARWWWCRWRTRSGWRSSATAICSGATSRTARATSTAATPISRRRSGTAWRGGSARMRRRTSRRSGRRWRRRWRRWSRKARSRRSGTRCSRLAHDADLVLDLHADNQAVMHLYTGTPLWPEVRDLAAELGARAVLLAEVSGGNPFDEACSGPWWALAAALSGGGDPVGLRGGDGGAPVEQRRRGRAGRGRRAGAPALPGAARGGRRTGRRRCRRSSARRRRSRRRSR